MIEKITPTEMAAFTIKFGKGAFPHQRFGQAFCNEFDYADSELFAQKERRIAEEYIWLQYVL